MSKQLRRAVKAAGLERTTPPLSPVLQPPPPTEQPPPPVDEETREAKVYRLLERARRPLSNSQKLERGSSNKEVLTTTVEAGDSLKRSSSYREQKSPRMITSEPEPAKRTASSGSLPGSPRRLSVDLTGLLTSRRADTPPPPASPRRSRSNSLSAPPERTYTRIIYTPSPMGAFLTAPLVFLLPNDTTTDEVRMALEKAHGAEFGAGEANGFEEVDLKADAIYLCDEKSTLYLRVSRRRWPAGKNSLSTCLLRGAPDTLLSGDGAKRVVTHEYIFKHPV